MVDHEDFDQRTEEEGRLINDPSSPSTPNLTQVHGMSRSQNINLYTSHFLSTWNVRSYEFAAIIFTADAYPHTLIASSIRGIVRTVASICLSSIVGRWVDGSPNRMEILSTTISFNRFAVILSCILWLGIAESANLNDEASSTSGFQLKLTPGLKNGMFSLILLLGVIETLSANGNMLSMERDFVPTAADPTHMKYNLTYLNSVMRRIDLTCKLLAPIMISVTISTTSVRIGILVVATMNALSWGFELWCAKRVWNRNSRLRVLKVRHIGISARVTREVGEEAQRTFAESISQIVRLYGNNFRNYFRSQVWIPSFSLALLHLSALSYGATFITFLLGSGFSLGLITAARACGSIVEINSTFVTPVGVRYLGKAKRHDFIHVGESYNEEYDLELLESTSKSSDTDSMTETGLQRLGLWGITSQLLCLVPVLYAMAFITSSFAIDVRNS